MFTFYFFVLICLSRHNVANSIAYLLLPMNGGKSVGFTINSSPKSTQPITTANLKLTLILTLVLTLSNSNPNTNPKLLQCISMVPSKLHSGPSFFFM